MAKVSEKQEGEKRDSPAASFAQKESTANEEAIVCYCCGDADCRLNRCEKKNIWPKEKWSKPEYYKEKYHKKQNHSQVTNNESKKKSVTFADEDGEKKSECADGNTKKASCVFFGAQRVKGKKDKRLLWSTMSSCE